MIAGEGVLRPALESQAKQAGLEREVKFLGWVPEAARRALPVCDIFVQSSRWEAMSVVLLEAMAAGKPIVTTAVGENAHVVENGISGFVVPPQQPRALAETLGKLLKDASLRTSFSAAARKRFEQHFTVERMIGEHEKLYRELVGTRHPQSPSIESASNSPADA
jgi:glycosyltransferase involved in cell wall biosynthesis